jgi:sugar/nucleoside kinase (ribokinase family)
MVSLVPLEPVDYLVIGHVTEDITPSGPRLGGTAAFAALTARRFGLRVGILTSVSANTSLEALEGIPLLKVPSPHSTVFENLQTVNGRRQILHTQAAPITVESLPEVWRRVSIVHLAPVAQELPADCAQYFSTSLLGITPQGWMRMWDEAGQVAPCNWDSAGALLPVAGAVVFSREDVAGDEAAIEAMSHQTRVLVVTEGAAGCALYWNGDRRRFRAPGVHEVDDVGAGDVFAAAFFIRLHTTRDPWEAARFATLLAARSVTRPGLQGIPTLEEIEGCGVEVLQ